VYADKCVDLQDGPDPLEAFCETNPDADECRCVLHTLAFPVGLELRECTTVVWLQRCPRRTALSKCNNGRAGAVTQGVRGLRV
jgi:CP12 domain